MIFKHPVRERRTGSVSIFPEGGNSGIRLL
eukprot:COSAG02_NODE_1834_length_10718_cov_3.893775_1_plen_29_part_10